MSLLRKSSLNQLKKIQKIVDKEKGSNKKEKVINNQISVHNPIEDDIKNKRKIITYDQMFSIDIPENTKNENNKMKKINENIIVKPEHAHRDDVIDLINYLDDNSWEYRRELAEKMELDHVIISTKNVSREEVKELKDWLDEESWNNQYLNENKIFENGPNDTPKEIMRNMKTIKNWFEYTNSPNPIKSRDILTPGKQITVGDIEGIINRIDGSKVFIEVLNKEGINMVEMSLNKVLKAYKVKKEKTVVKADLSLQGPNNASKSNKAKEDKPNVKKVEDKATKAKDQKISDKINKVKKFKDWK